MGTLTLELSDERLRILERLAQQQGTSVNALVISLINDLAEQGKRHNVYDVTQDPLFSITSHDTGALADESKDPKTGSLYFIEVKGEWEGSDGLILTRNEILCSRNEPEKFRLAIVIVGEDGPPTAPLPCGI